MRQPTITTILVLISSFVISHSLYTGKNNWRKSPFTNINEERRDICAEVASFTPNFCSSSAAQQYCNWLCDERKNQDFLTCGRKVLKPKQKVFQRYAERLRSIIGGNARFRRVIGGVGSQAGEWPWQVSLRINGTQWCGGSILSSRYILTAAHCFDEYITSLKPEDWHVYAGDHALHSRDRFEQQVKVKRVFFHDEYFLYLHQHRKGSWVTADNDIAIMELAHPIDLQHEHRGQICLPDNNRPIKGGQYCHVIGWGHTSYNGNQPDHLMHAVVVTVPNSICNSEMAYNGTVTEKYLLCAGFKNGGIDACNYDSGGAMVCKQNNQWYAQGIVSSGFECARPNAYGLYTRISQDKEWIIETLLKSAAGKPFY